MTDPKPHADHAGDHKPVDHARQTQERESKKARHEAAEKARDEAGKAAATAAEDKAKVEEKKLTPEEKAARESAQKADDAAAKAAEADRAARGTTKPMTVEDAKVAAPVDPAMPAGHHMAQKFGNDPANPKSIPFTLPNGQSVPMESTVRLSRKTPDHADLVHTTCQPNMVGDYLRAGWNIDDVQTGMYPLTKEEQVEADKRAAADKQAAAAHPV